MLAGEPRQGRKAATVACPALPQFSGTSSPVASRRMGWLLGRHFSPDLEHLTRVTHHSGYRGGGDHHG